MSRYHLSFPHVYLSNRNASRTEHIWWDQATALRQAGILPVHLTYPTSKGPQVIRLPVAGAETAAKLVNETSVASNAMITCGQGLEAEES